MEATYDGCVSKPRWLFDEGANAGPEHLDPQYVQAYDNKAAFDPSNDLATLRDRGLGRGRTLVDLGCGTGEFALAAAEVVDRVVAVDVSEPMLDTLRAKAKVRGVTNVEAVRAGFLTYQHTGSPADFIYTRHALHHLPDFWKAIALQRVADTLSTGGLLLLRDLIYSFDPSEAGSKLEGWLASASREVGVGWTREELERHLRDEYSTFSWVLEPMLTKAGLTIDAAWASDSGIYAAYLCLKV